MKRVIIIHGWADDPNKGWISWLVNKLNNEGYQVVAPQMPNPKWPNQKKWLEKINQVVGPNIDNLILVGHSLGCFLLLRFLEQKNLVGKLEKLILVAGFIKPKDLTFEKYFLPAPDFSKIKAKINKSYCVYSDNDLHVLSEQSFSLAKRLDASLVLDKGKKHFATKQGIIELPSVYKLILGKEEKNER